MAVGVLLVRFCSPVVSLLLAWLCFKGVFAHLQGLSKVVAYLYGNMLLALFKMFVQTRNYYVLIFMVKFRVNNLGVAYYPAKCIGKLHAIGNHTTKVRQLRATYLRSVKFNYCPLTVPYPALASVCFSFLQA